MELRDRIIVETYKLIVSKSCKLITMDEIANNLGISKRTLYENFKDKSTLIEDCLNTNFEQANEKVRKIMDKSENSLVSFMLMTQMGHQSIAKIGYDNISDIKKYYPQIYSNTFLKHVEFHKNNTYQLIQLAMNEGLIIKKVDINFIQNMLRIFLFYCSKNEYLSLNPEFNASKLFNIHLFIAMRGISTLKGIEIIDKYQEKFIK
ncbi:MAG: TetR/AcrR family transcriptional regulator [Bacteroidales bacterium]|nr:TetR/AcrR family transcriptional regulator [Bacteroidales bacterium]MDD2576697.1 TetR/AcrR family transcriptional regulator [Bacteroidales bacterium]MDD3286597.1 TetR/AcrR family transcriptional regulator [Bacteroidales bacterium]MDD4738622.1 TetR/AcrR family transcriptional regulator [Bacteroidales bacterium]